MANAKEDLAKKENFDIQINKYKEEYTKSSFTIKNISFTFSKLPAIKGAFIFMELVEKLGANINISKNFSSEGSAKVEQMAMIVEIIRGGLCGLNDGFLKDKLMPSIFKTLSFSRDGSKDGTGEESNLNAHDNQDLLEASLGFEDILELLLRGVCYHFLTALLAKLQGFGVKKKA